MDCYKDLSPSREASIAIGNVRILPAFGTSGKGIVPDHWITFLEGLAKSKGLV